MEKIFLTHPDKDHYNLIAAAKKYFNVNGMVYHTYNKECYKHCKKDGALGEQKLTDIFNPANIKRIVNKDCTDMNDPTVIYQICNKRATITVLASELGYCCGDKNEDSLVLLLKYGTVTALFVGDLEGYGVETVEKCINHIHVDILRLSHHGSITNKANRDTFLDAVYMYFDLWQQPPRFLAFSSSDPCRKGWEHPHCDIFKWFLQAKTPPTAPPHPYTCRVDRCVKQKSHRPALC